MRAHSHAGFTLLEIMISVAIVGILLAVGVPSFMNYMQNQQIRASAESVLAGMQVAKAEAIRRNVRVQIKMEDIASQRGSWRVNLGSDPDGTPIQRRYHDEGGTNTVLTPEPNTADTITFDALGRVVTNADASPSLTRITFDTNAIAAAERRPLQINIPPAGGFRMCDPQLPAGNPRAC